MKPTRHRQALWTGAFIILFGALPGTSTGKELPKFKLTVKVVYSNGHGVPGAVVTVTHDRFGPEMRPYDYRIEAGPTGVATIEINPTGWGEGVAYWPTLDIEAKKGAGVGRTTVKVTGTRFTSGVRYRDVEVTLPIEGDAEADRAKINIAVSVSDGTTPIPSTGITIKGPEGTYTGRTDADGKVSIAVPFIPKAEYWVGATKRGYEPKDRLVLLDASPASSVDAPITLKKSATPDGIVVTINVKKEGSPDPVREAHIKVSDTSGIVSEDYYKTTNGAGVAVMRLPGPGTYPLSIEQDTFEPFQGTIELKQGDEARTFDYTLKEKGGTESITITVLAGDIKNGLGGYEPIRGASVIAGPVTGVTDDKGQVTLTVKSGIAETDKGAGYAETVKVTVSKNGYKTQARPVQLKRQQHRNLPGSASETFTLERGDDQASDTTPIMIVVEVRDSIGPVPLADVTLASLGTGQTDRNGEKTFDSGNVSPEVLANLRKGIAIKVTHTGHKPYDKTIDAQFLQPSMQARRYSVILAEDWDPLEKAVTSLEQEIAAWKRQAKVVRDKAQSIAEISTKGAEVRRRGESLLGELKAARKAADAKRSESACKEAKDLEKSILQWRDDAVAREKTLRATLDEAISLAATCKSKADADTIRAKQKSALVLTAELGRLEKQALEDDKRLGKLVQSFPDPRPTIQLLQQIVAKIEQEASAAGKDAAAAENGFDDAVNLAKTLPGIPPELLKVYDQKRAEHHVREYYEVLPGDLRKRLDNLEAVLGPRGNDVSLGFPPSIDRSRLKFIHETLSVLEEHKRQAVAIVDEYSQMKCDAQPLDHIVKELEGIMSGVTIELGAAGDLLGKADACEAKLAAVPSPTPTPTPTAKPTPTPAPTPTPSPTPQSDEITVPDFKGYTDPSKMIAVATQAGLKPSLVASKEAPASDGAGVVVRQNPLANAKAKRGDPLTIFLSQKKLTAPASPTPTPVASATPSPKGGDEVIVPSIPAGITGAEAKATLSAAGLAAAFNAKGGNPGSQDLEFKTTGAQDIPGGTKVKRGATVTVSIYQKYESKPSPSATASASPRASASATVAAGAMPDLTGKTLEQAVALLPSNMEITSDEVGDKPPKPELALTIFAQKPAAGTKYDPKKPPVVSVKRYGSAKTDQPTSSSDNPLGGVWKADCAGWSGIVTDLETGRPKPGGEWQFYMRKRKAGGFDCFFNSEPLDEVQIQGGKVIGKTPDDSWVSGMPEILRAIFRVTFEPTAGGKVLVTMSEDTFMRAGGEKKKPIMRGELAPITSEDVAKTLAKWSEATVDLTLQEARKRNKEHEDMNARSK